MRTWLNQLYRYALVVVDGLEHNPAADPDVLARPKPPAASRAQSVPEPGELPEFLRTYHVRTVTTQLGLRLLLLTGLRTGELRRTEPSQFQLDQGLWVIPPTASSNGKLNCDEVGDAPKISLPISSPIRTGHRDRAVSGGESEAGATLPATAAQRPEKSASIG